MTSPRDRVRGEDIAAGLIGLLMFALALYL